MICINRVRGEVRRNVMQLELSKKVFPGVVIEQVSFVEIAANVYGLGISGDAGRQ